MTNDFFLINDFIIRAIIAGLIISIIAGPFGAVIVWRRLSYFGDNLAHSSLLGAAIAVALNINIYYGLLGICLLIASLLLKFINVPTISQDTVLNILSSAILAIGLIVATQFSSRLNVLEYLYGDILAITNTDLFLICIVVFLVLLLVVKFWRSLLLLVLNEDLAKGEGLPVRYLNIGFVFIMALVFAITMKFFGILLIVALFVIPVSSARQFANSPEMMAILGSIFSAISVIIGVVGSYFLDWPTGPTIVVVSSGIFILSFIGRIGNEKL